MNSQPTPQSASKQISPGSYDKSVTLTYRWRCESFPQGIPSRLREALDETAEKRAFEMRGKGFSEGELIDYVNMKLPGIRTPEDGFYCKGWFEFKEA